MESKLCLYGDDSRPAKLEVKRVEGGWTNKVYLWGDKGWKESKVNLADFLRRAEEITKEGFDKAVESWEEPKD